MINWERVLIILADAVLWMLSCGFVVCTVMMAMFVYYSIRDYRRSRDKMDLEPVTISLILLIGTIFITALMICLSIKLVN